jgi:hypothetical protein
MASCRPSSTGVKCSNNANFYERTAETLFSVGLLGIFFTSSKFINVFGVVVGDFSAYDVKM